MRLRIADLSKIYYPDVHLVRDPTDRHPEYSTRPRLIVEVLSRTTSRTDRG